MSSHSTDKPHIIQTSSLKDSDFTTKVHSVDPSAVRHTIPLGDLTGLTKVGVHLVRLPPHSKSVANHWHTQDDEWIYVLEAGEQGATLVRVKGENEAKEETIRKGDFVAFPASSGVGHHIETKEEGIVYLVSGTRAPVDVCSYPLEGKKLVVDRTGNLPWYTEEGGIEWYNAAPMAGVRRS
ncbi:hypothetical protein BDY19DRAFT_889452 [Irpex rosettiformis]|uniref:Uncharacterized protein n=1 Tax=Irpex rosettiformis TaxID=378272 RepID=A0ACB8U639_9APHY|nr:hypothetical protein BDY19DRAFT_889452 [Irpex rosettiformis]